jgi:hypothetical protein
VRSSVSCSLLDWWRRHMGSGCSATRAGAQALSLLG